MKLRINQGVLFSGNTLTGVVGLRAQGFVYLAGLSLVRQFTPRFSLGAELTAAQDPRGEEASRAALQQQVGGKYGIRENLTIDFGVTLGQLGESPRVALQVGLSIYFQSRCMARRQTIESANHRKRFSGCFHHESHLRRSYRPERKPFNCRKSLSALVHTCDHTASLV